MFLHSRLLFRELMESRKQALIFVLCVMLSLTTIVALNGFRRDVNHSVLGDAKSLHGADIIIHSYYDISAPVMDALVKMENENKISTVRKYEFYSMVRGEDNGEALLANIKITSEGYPLYGQVKLASGRDLAEVLVPGKVIVEQTLLERLQMEVGEYLTVGKGRMLVADVVVLEPDRPVKIFSFGPRVLVAAADSEALDLIHKGSRIEHEILVKLAEGDQLASIEAVLKKEAIPHQERINTYRNARSGMKIFFDNLLFFLSFISIFTLFLAGLGIQSSLAAFFRQKEKSIAMIKAMGGTTRFLYRHYLVLVISLGLVGSVFGITSGLLLERFFPILFEGFLPGKSVMSFSALDVIQGLLLGLGVIVFFSFLPLYRLRNVKPIAVFREENRNGTKGRMYYLFLILGFLFLTGLVIGQLDDVTIGLLFMAGVLVMVGGISLLTRLSLYVVSKVTFSSLGMRQGGRSLIRPGNATHSIILTLASALSVLFTIYLVEANLQSTYIESYPTDAPNLFCLDIQPDQREAFLAETGREVQLFPVVRARVVAINGDAIVRQKELKKKRDSFAREFNLTYREELLNDENLVAGESLFPAMSTGKQDVIPVSILDTVAGMGGIELHDILQFNIQGVLIEARVSSIRTRTKSKLYPFFYFVFPESVLTDAPRTYFAALRISADELGRLEKRVGAIFPNISFIDVTSTAKILGELLRDISTIVTFFAMFSILAGGLILISSILSTRYARIREAVYYKILGGNSVFVSLVFVHEHVLLGVISSLIGVIVAQAGSWGLCHYLFEIDYGVNILPSLLLVAFTVFLVVIVGGMGSFRIIFKKPSQFLREQPQD